NGNSGNKTPNKTPQRNATNNVGIAKTGVGQGASSGLGVNIGSMGGNMSPEVAKVISDARLKRVAEERYQKWLISAERKKNKKRIAILEKGTNMALGLIGKETAA